MSRRTLKLCSRLDVYLCGSELAIEILKCECFIVGRFDDGINFHSPHTPIQSMKKLEGKIMIFVRHFDDVVPHLVHTRLKSRKESFDTLARKLNEIFILTAIGLKKPCLDGIGSFMKALKARPYLVSNFKITNSIKFISRKT